MNPLHTSLIIAASVIIWATILGTNISHIWPNAGAEKTITVQGEGKSFLVPNIYSFSITANETGATTKIVNESLAKQLDQAQKILDTYKIDKKDIQSSNIDIQPNREYDGNKSIEKWYRGTHTLTIKIRKIEDAGKVIDNLTAINGLLVNGGNYTNDNESYTLEKARKNAFENAKSKAESLAELSNMKLGKPISINENIIGNNSYPMYKAMKMDSVAWSISETIINPWEQELQVQVNIVFAMN
jgi:uncharacterized protein